MFSLCSTTRDGIPPIVDLPALLLLSIDSKAIYIYLLFNIYLKFNLNKFKNNEQIIVRVESMPLGSVDIKPN